MGDGGVVLLAFVAFGVLIVARGLWVGARRKAALTTRSGPKLVGRSRRRLRRSRAAHRSARRARKETKDDLGESPLAYLDWPQDPGPWP
jgi:hypothetical protein